MIVITSCREEPSSTPQISDSGGVEVVVKHSAGDGWAATDKFLPLPFNVAELGSQKAIVLSDRIKVGEKLEVKPFGAVRVTENDSLHTYVVTYPIASKYNPFGVADFDEFSTVHSGAKWIIEQYILNRQNSNEVRLKSWEDENFAIKYVLK